MSYEAEVLADNPSEVWRCDTTGSSEPGIVAGTTMTLFGAPPVRQPGPFDKEVSYSIALNGSTQYVDFTTAAEIDAIWQNGGSLEYWVKVDGTQGGVLIGKQRVTSTPIGWDTRAVNFAGGLFQFQFMHRFVNGGANQGVWVTDDLFELGSWYHVVVVYNYDSPANDPTVYIQKQARALTETQTPVGSRLSDESYFGRAADDANGGGRQGMSLSWPAWYKTTSLSAARVEAHYDAGATTSFQDPGRGAFPTVVASAQDAFGGDYDLLASYTPATTGLIAGGNVTNPSATTFTVAAGTGYILNPGDTTDGRYLAWPEQANIPIVAAAAWKNIIVFVDGAGAVVQILEENVAPYDVRDKIIVTSVKLDGSAEIDSIHPTTHTPANGPLSFLDYLFAIDEVEFIFRGVILEANGATLELKYSDGVLFSYGENFQVDASNPNFVPVVGVTAFPITRILSDGTTYAASTDVDVGNYESAPGVRSNLLPSRWTIHLVVLRNGTYWQQYGQQQYSSFNEAYSNLSSYLETVDFAPILQTNREVLGGVIARGNETDLSSSDAMVFDRTVVSGGVGGGGSGSVTTVAGVAPQPDGNVQLDQLQDRTDSTKFLRHDLAGIAAATTQTVAWQAVDGTVAIQNGVLTANSIPFVDGSGRLDEDPTLVRAATTGYVGVGTATPRYNLEAYGAGQNTPEPTDAGARGGTLSLLDSTTAVNGGGMIVFGNESSRSKSVLGWAAIKAVFQNSANNTQGDLVFATRTNSADTALTEVMRVTRNLRVGVNTATPVALFHASSGSAGTWTPSPQADEFILEHSVNAGTSVIVPDNAAGSYVVGSPSNNQGAVLAWRYSTKFAIIGSFDPLGQVQLWAGNAQAVTITYGGNVGIADPTPTEKLSVTGNVAIPADNLFMLNGSGVQTGIRYNSGTGNIEIVKAGTVVASW